MRLSDIVSHAGLAGYAEVALILFFAVFVTVVIRLFGPGGRRDIDHLAHLPLDDPSTGPTTDAARGAAGAES
jgi:cbb3-type cytochrome oxidase subunit 3